MRTLRTEMNRGHGWELRAEGKIPAAVTTEQIRRDLQEYAIQYPAPGIGRLHSYKAGPVVHAHRRAG
jgi:hypothetical protein